MSGWEEKVKKTTFISAALLAALILGSCGSAAGEGSRIILDDVTQTHDEREDNGDRAETAPAAQESAVQSAQTPESASAELKTIVVHVCGAVEDEGVYVLEAGSRVYEAVRAAGGFSEDADEEYVNQAQVLSDGVRLRIPTLEETAQAYSAQDAAAEAPETGYGADDNVPDVITAPEDPDDGSDTSKRETGKVDINTADEAKLCTLKGVGPATAAKIIAYRESSGGFTRIEDIMKVSGIKEKLFAKIKDDITV